MPRSESHARSSTARTLARPAEEGKVAGGREGAGAPGEDATITALTGLLWEALRELGNAGEPQRANRIGGRAWSALRHRDAAGAQRINGLMHRLARQEAVAGAVDHDPQGS